MRSLPDIGVMVRPLELRFEAGGLNLSRSTRVNIRIR